MNEAATQILADGLLKGGFDVLDALLTSSFNYAVSESKDSDEAALAAVLGTHTLALQGNIQGGGVLALLLSLEESTKLVSHTKDGEPTAAEALDDAGIESLKEIADGVLGGGVTHLAERFGEEMSIESFEVVQYTTEQASDLANFLGDGPVQSAFTFSADPHYDSSGYLLTSAALEARVPDSQVDSGDALVSDDEMKDILSGFSPEDETAGYAGSDEGIPENMEIVLGIDLTATARLGKVEMPIADLLALGPGSIIEVGHVVDEPVELLVNGHLIARGDVVVVDEKFGLRITEIISPRERIERFR